ncbi:MAG: PD40 domain-containing protein, partial [Planctomycetota bacterium]
MCLRYLIGIVFLSVSVAVCVAEPVEQTHPFSVHDILAMERISDPQVSPDGEWIVFVLRKTDLEENLGRTDLWLVRADGTGLRRLTSDPANDSNPRWSADGESIWFLSKRSESSQVWRIRIDGGEAEQVTDLPLDVGNLVVSRDGQHIAFTMEVFVDCDSIECTKERLEEIENRKASGRIY